MHDEVKQQAALIAAGDFRALARAITLVENELPGCDEMMALTPVEGKPKVVGITGPPGAGKSTLVNALAARWLSEGRRVAVLAVDPSSPFNFGALLGDRVRMNDFYDDPNIYIRSLASRGALGGLTARIIEIAELVKCAPFDRIIVETVGVGQSEVEIAGLADCTVVALVPEAGDMVQTLKAGVMEIADIFVVNKSDRDAADALYNHLRIMVHEKEGKKGEIPVIKTVATNGAGIAELDRLIEWTLHEGSLNADKKARLLTERCWQLIQAYRMKGLDKKRLYELIAATMNETGFSLYRLSRQLSNGAIL